MDILGARCSGCHRHHRRRGARSRRQRPGDLRQRRRPQLHGRRPVPVGSIVVKEIYARNDDDSAGAYRYSGIMRKLEVAPGGGELDDGWLFTYQGELDGVETHRPRCWKTCHQNAPFDGAFFNWSALAD